MSGVWRLVLALVSGGTENRLVVLLQLFAFFNWTNS